MQRSIVALVTDLIFATKIASTARALGVDLRVTRSLEAFCAELANAPAMAIIDLNATGIDPLGAVRAARAAVGRPRTIAYASHVQTELIDAARAAGADVVLPRSAFSEKLPHLLSDVQGGINDAARTAES